MTVAPGTGTNKDGVVVTNVDSDSDAAQKGIKSGDVILEVGGLNVKTPDDVANGVKEATKLGRKAVLMRVKSGSEMRFVAGAVEEELSAFGAKARPSYKPRRGVLFSTADRMPRLMFFGPIVSGRLDAPIPWIHLIR